MSDTLNKSNNLNTSDEHIKAVDITETVREQVCSILYDDDYPILGTDEQKRINELVNYIKELVAPNTNNPNAVKD